MFRYNVNNINVRKENIISVCVPIKDLTTCDLINTLGDIKKAHVDPKSVVLPWYMWLLLVGAAFCGVCLFFKLSEISIWQYNIVH